MGKSLPAIFVAVVFGHVIATQSVHFWRLIMRLAVHVIELPIPGGGERDCRWLFQEEQVRQTPLVKCHEQIKSKHLKN